MRFILNILGVHRFVLGLILAAFAMAVATSRAAAAQEPTLVQVDGGKVQGTAANDLIVFKGIPFAQPPVGALRWRPP
jgi:para-nitrobenzyl esterase